MEWRIDTGMVGEVKVSELQKTLEASRDHWLKTQAKAAGEAVAHAATGNMGKPGQPSPDMTAVGKASMAAEEAHQGKSATLAAAMDLGIKQACEQAELYQDAAGGSTVYVTATVQGHDNPRHASAVSKRLSVQVDQTWKE